MFRFLMLLLLLFGLLLMIIIGFEFFRQLAVLLLLLLLSLQLEVAVVVAFVVGLAIMLAAIIVVDLMKFGLIGRAALILAFELALECVDILVLELLFVFIGFISVSPNDSRFSIS